jgi:hypothetical protein
MIIITIILTTTCASITNGSMQKLKEKFSLDK